MPILQPSDGPPKRRKNFLSSLYLEVEEAVENQWFTITCSDRKEGIAIRTNLYRIYSTNTPTKVRTVLWEEFVKDTTVFLLYIIKLRR